MITTGIDSDSVGTSVHQNNNKNQNILQKKNDQVDRSGVEGEKESGMS
jgi:hypothetical protein